MIRDLPRREDVSPLAVAYALSVPPPVTRDPAFDALGRAMRQRIHARYALPPFRFGLCGWICVGLYPVVIAMLALVHVLHPGGLQ